MLVHLARPMNVECIIGDCVRHSPHADLNSDIATYLNSLPSSLSLSAASTHQRDCRVVSDLPESRRNGCRVLWERKAVRSASTHHRLSATSEVAFRRMRVPKPILLILRLEAFISTTRH